MSRATARTFVRYFAQVIRDGGDDHFRRGLACAEEWERLSAEARPSRTAVVALLERFEAEPQPGSGWLDLHLHVTAWAKGLVGDEGDRGGEGVAAP